MKASFSAIALVLSLAFSASAEQFGLFTYRVNGDSVEISDYPENAVGPVEIPEEIDGKPIAKQMLNELAAREGVDYVDLQASISLPERGRSFTKNRGEKHISAHG